VSAAVIAAITLAAGAGVGYLVGHEGPPTRAAVTSPEVRALLAPLAIGGDLGGFTIADIGPVDHGVVRIDLTRGAEKHALGIALAVAPDAGPPPPLSVGRYALFYFGPAGAALDAPLARLGDVLRAHADLPPPAGLGPLRRTGPDRPDGGGGGRIAP
jgi:hypothetical protein